MTDVDTAGGGEAVETADSDSDVQILVVDNYDSFAYNLVQYVGTVADEVVVRRNDAVDVDAVRAMDPTGIVVSPGPGTPEEAGVSMALFEETTYPILGVCLGHQALCAAAGASVVRAPSVVHGKPSVVTHDGTGLFRGLPERFQVGRYHSLAVERGTLPPELVATARTADDRDLLMAVAHRENPHYGVQFHPESILTRRVDAERRGGEDETDDESRGISLELGHGLVANFCALAAASERDGMDGADGERGSTDPRRRSPPVSDERRCTRASDDLLYHVDGDLVPASEATVSVADRGVRYGDGVFETLRAYGGTLFEWDAHADRLDRSCAALSLDHGRSRADLRARIDETLAANDLADAYVRLSITRGVQAGLLTPDPDVDPTVVVVAKPLPRGGVDGTPVWDGPATVETVDTRRIPDAAIPAGAKTLNYLNGILARAELGPDADEALLRDGDGHVAEGATSNLFFVRDGVVHTPTTEGPVLPGITRRVVLALAREAGVPVREGRYEVSDVRAADEAFLTNTTWEVRPIASLDGTSIGGGPVTDRLARAFDAYVESTCYEG